MSSTFTIDRFIGDRVILSNIVAGQGIRTPLTTNLKSHFLISYSNYIKLTAFDFANLTSVQIIHKMK